MLRRVLLCAAAAASIAGPASAITFINQFGVPGTSTDLSGMGPSPNQSRLSFGSDLIYDSSTRVFTGLTDRGPGGGLLDYAPRSNGFKLGIDKYTGEVSSFTMKSTAVFHDGSDLFTGLNPALANGSVAVLGRSFDSEGVARLPNGHMLVSDEYGPSVYEFSADGQYVRAFTTPDNLLPKKADATLDYVNGRGTITTGRQDNRGYEGLTLSPDGTKAYAILQDPLVNEGASNDGRRSQNLRIVEYDVASGTSTKQYIYQLESRTDINARVTALDPAAPTFSATDQGRSIGVSSITAVGDGKFLVIERDNRGQGVTDPNGTTVVGSKRVYLIDLAGASDVSGLNLTGTSVLPPGVTPVSKTLFLDVAAALRAAGVAIPEKIEGLAFGPRLAGGVSLILVTDNDFSVTQNDAGAQFDICTSGLGAGGTFSQVAIGAGCPDGQSLIPSYIMAFKVTDAELRAAGIDPASFGAIPEPGAWAMMIAGFAGVGTLARRRRRVACA